MSRLLLYHEPGPHRLGRLPPRVGGIALLVSSLLSNGLAEPAPQRGAFSDVPQATGLHFTHANGMTGLLLLPEITGSGGAFLDFDNDGDLDVYAVQGGPLDQRELGARLGGAADQMFRNRLAHRNDSDAFPDFDNVTEHSGISAAGYGMGVATGDYDNDGWVDLYVTNFGANQLFRNNGDGSFSDVTEQLGVGYRHWSTSASFLDYDGDGWLDLYVANYVAFDLDTPPRCYAASSRLDYCGPDTFEPQADSLFLSRDGVSFEEVSRRALSGYEALPGLGVAAAYLDSDDEIDIYVANDGRPNQLWTNRGDGTFFDDALLSGTAVNRDGLAEASMGIAVADFDADGDQDLFVTHLNGETNTLYQRGGDFFDDRTGESGLGAPSLPFTGFGVVPLDFDRDGRIDLFVANGAVRILESLARVGNPHPLGERNQLFRGSGGADFEEVTDWSVPRVAAPGVSRGTAAGDVDNDGDVDILVFNNGDRAHLLMNTLANDTSWVGLQLVGSASNRQGLGARVEITTPSGPVLAHLQVHTDGSYCSAHDPRLLVRLPPDGTASVVRVVWSRGSAEEFRVASSGSYAQLRQGTGTPLPMGRTPRAPLSRTRR